MRIAPDKQMHLKLGIPLSLVIALTVAVALFVGPGYAVMFGSVALGIGVEIYQKIRNEGQFEWSDAACSAAFGVCAGLWYELWRLA